MRVFLVALLFLYTSSAYSITGYKPPDQLYGPLINQLLEEIKVLLGLEVPSEQPQVLVTTREQLVEAYCNKDVCNVAAVTDSKSGIIYIDSKLELGNIYNVSILYHELVHFVQIKKGMFVNLNDCERWAAAEMHAYKAQSDWLQYHDVRGFNVPDLTIQCR